MGKRGEGGGGVHKKSIERRNCLKAGLGQFANLTWGLVKKRGSSF